MSSSKPCLERQAPQNKIMIPFPAFCSWVSPYVRIGRYASSYLRARSRAWASLHHNHVAPSRIHRGPSAPPPSGRTHPRARARKPGRYYSLVYPQYGWKVLSVRPMRSGRKRMMRTEFSNLGTFDVLVHRDFPLDKAARVTVKMDRAGEIHAIFYVEDFNPYEPLPHTGRVAGMDVGTEKLLTTSDGGYAPNPRVYERALGRLQRDLQRELSHRQRGSRRMLRTKYKLARAHKRVAGTRKDLYLKLGKILAGLYDLVVMEDLNVKGLA
ncbi:MAG TPA: transposase, partial [Nitrososphaeria archaeon]|nr:transposase [Nitrososphaeria archaeon]